jgi:transposase-like protein
MINKKDIEALTKQAAKIIKATTDLSDLTQVLTNVAVEAALNNELEEYLGYSRHDQCDSTSNLNSCDRPLTH